ncbi:AAA family ATPase [Bacteroidales bacterium OttesenSCG-928-K03]|nr:AAA family ATPase [Odoribacter sp. OttesenSCG-928-L07]MDL2240822.1 AAA family ATPase [Bacteroidales bacterium OttesenSCG-928-K22]MDL2242396.1 AAA family ATPase [Bacteroidales bacterium OttesenSCG-928-K03]
MQTLIEKSQKKIVRTKMDFVRNYIYEFDWNTQLVGIRGARGIGKTTLLLQYIKMYLLDEIDAVLYVSLDDIWFSDNRLVTLVDQFVKHGGKYLFLDEVHKYPDWSVEIKNIYDDYPELKVVFTGSSLLEILNSRADLSRRAIMYEMQGLSFREYLNLELGFNFKIYTLEEILNNHFVISQDIINKIRPLQYFEKYLTKGYYPIFRESIKLYYTKIDEIINTILEVELPLLRNISPAYIQKLKQLLYVISESSPFIPNISGLSTRIGINRETLLTYLFNIHEAQLIFEAYQDVKGVTRLQKPDKIFMENSNLMYALRGDSVEIGNVRETFFANQLKHKHILELAGKSDFHIDGKYTFEIGGKNKDTGQISGIQNSYLALDNIECGHKNRIPLWLFGFLY